MTKENINKRGYNKFLEISDEVHTRYTKKYFKKNEKNHQNPNQFDIR